jgi:hypothetical protein
MCSMSSCSGGLKCHLGHSSRCTPHSLCCHWAHVKALHLRLCFAFPLNMLEVLLHFLMSGNGEQVPDTIWSATLDLLLHGPCFGLCRASMQSRSDQCM